MDHVAEVQRVVLREQRAPVAQGGDGRDGGHDLHVPGVVPPDRQEVLVDLLRDLEVLLHVVLPLVRGTAEDEVREDSEEELLAVLLAEGVVELALVHEDGLADEVHNGHALPVLLEPAADVAGLADGAALLEAVEEGHAGGLRPQLRPADVHLLRAEDADLRAAVEDGQHLPVPEEGVQHGLRVVLLDLLLHPERAHGHLRSEPPFVEERLDALAAEGVEARIRQEVERKGLVLRPLLRTLARQQRHRRNGGRCTPRARRPRPRCRAGA
mmetsp:Transcript_104553/g.337181  ORF Transcript_104553/g.337181 Transcript_104553/m.337181 type:complete len:269 (-) Transcript_104553:5-811(-)